MEKFENWKEKTLGIYVYPISPGCAYEIHINYWDKKTDIIPHITSYAPANLTSP